MQIVSYFYAVRLTDLFQHNSAIVSRYGVSLLEWRNSSVLHNALYFTDPQTN